MYLTDFFSVRICLSTLFSVWHRDKIYYDHLSLSQVLEAWSLNFASRIIGFLVKMFTLSGYLLATFISALLSGLLFIIWLAFPVVLLALVYFGIKIYLGV